MDLAARIHFEKLASPVGERRKEKPFPISGPGGELQPRVRRGWADHTRICLLSKSRTRALSVRFSNIAILLPSWERLHLNSPLSVSTPDWSLFFLRREGVERFLFEAHQRKLLEYHVAGSVTRLTFPARTLEEYANVLAQR